MANPTTNFGWVMPTATDLVTDLPADFAVFGQGVDTSMQDLLGGTTGQVLSKTSGTNMDFTWINNDQGDLTAITAGTGISVTSGTGPIPSVAIDTAVTVDKTTAQTLTNKTLTTPIISSISNTGTLTLPTSTDTLVGRATTDTLTNKTLTSPALTTPTISTLTTNGDVLYGTGSGALSRLGIGSTSQVLTVTGGVPVWATPAGGGGMTQILAPTSIVSSPTQNTFTTSSISGSYNQLVIYIKDFKADNYFGLSVRFNSDATADAYQSAAVYSSGASAYAEAYRGTYGMIFNNMYGSTDDNFAMITIPNYANTTTRKVAYGNTAYVADDTNFANQIGAVSWKNTAAISTITLYTVDSGYSSGKWTGGTIEIYGVN